MTPLRCVTLSDCNIENFNGLLQNDADAPEVEVIATPYGQVHQLLMDPTADCWTDQPDAAVVWTRPEGVLASFARALHEPVSHEQVLEETDRYLDALVALRDRVKNVFVPTWTLPPERRGLGMLDLKEGAARLLMRINDRLCARLEGESAFFALDAQRWQAAALRPTAPKSWYMAKLAFSTDVYKEAAADVKAGLRGAVGLARKLVVVDLDDTLWGGIVGELGWENLTLGGHDPIGEAFADFQRELKELTHRGILLGIVSKNEESVALDAIRNNPEMVLAVDDFAGWRINWMDKAQNIADLVAELNLGLQSTVFIDDNPAERARVLDTLPEVLVPDWPEDKTLYRKTLQELRCFDTPSLSKEDLERAHMYTVERERETSKQDVGSLDDWLHSLETELRVESLNDANLARTAQLLNKTNQMNLSTRRMTEAELKEWAGGDGRKLWTLRVRDKFGDLGLTGIVSLDGDTLVDFILSCRVFGRKIEHAMVSIALSHAKGQGHSGVVAQLLPTKKNKPCADFLADTTTPGERDDADKTLFRLSTDDRPIPAHLKLTADS